MGETFGKLKETAVSFLKKIYKPILITCIVIVLIAAMWYGVTLHDGSYKDGDESNTPYAVEQHTNNVQISSDGNITTAMTAQELWDKMLKDGSRVDEYLKNPEELQKLINAQIVTDYLDTRPNPDAEIDWDSLNKDVSSGKVQGIVKLKRAQSDGTTSTLTYVDADTFQMYIDEYNQTGSESAKQNALKHFTLEKGYKASNGGDYNTGTDGEAIIIEKGDVIEIPQGQNYGTTYTYNSWQLIGAGNQLKLKQQAGMTFDTEGFGRINGRYAVAVKPTFGKVGDYIDYYYIDKNGKEQIIPCIICDVKGQDAQNKWGHHNGKNILEFYVNEETWCTPDWGHGHSGYKSCGQASSMHVNPGTNGFHEEWQGAATKIVNGGSYFDNPNFGSETITSNKTSSVSGEQNTDKSENNTIGNGLMKWPTDGTQITSYFGPRNAPVAGASTNHGAIDIGVTTGTNIYATESGKVIGAGSAGNAGIMVTIDHGNGYLSKYMHCSSILVSVGETVEKGHLIAKSGATGNVSGPHLHFQIEFNGTKVDPLSFKYDNGMGDGTGGIGSDSDNVSTTATFYAKVATWSETNEIIQSDDPSVETTDPNGNPKYSMTTTKIDYKQFVNGVRMPFDYLWALLVISQDKDFVFELANLVYNSEVEITVHDNLSIVTSITTDTYTKKTKVTTENIKVKVEYDGNIASKTSSEIYEGEKEEGTYTTVTTNITKTNTLNTALTKANVWNANYSQEFTYQAPTGGSPTPSAEPYEHEDEEYPETPNRTDDIDTLGFAESYRKQIQNEYLKTYTNVSTEVTSLLSKYYYKIVDRTENFSSSTETAKYISSPAKTLEKTDKEAEEENFVTIFIKNTRAKNNILSATGVLFEILENSPDTVDMVDLTKYLLYKATGRDYGVTEYDIQIIDLNSTNKVKGNALENYIKLWENASLWKYETGQSSNLPTKYLTEDGQNYIVYEDGSYGHNNIAYGIATFISSKTNAKVEHPTYGKGYYNWQSKFSSHGIDVTTLKEGALVDRNAATAVFSDILAGFQNSVTSKLANSLPEYEFSQAQIDSLTAVCYQYGNIEAFPNAYRNSLNADGTVNAEQIRKNFSPFNYSKTVNDRKYANWILFTQEKYTNAAGEEVLMGGALNNWDGDTYSNDSYTFPVYNQYDSRWATHHYGGPKGSPNIPANKGKQKTIASSGCACCALSAVLSGYTGEAITPDMLTQKLDEKYPGGGYYSPGNGSNSGFLYDNRLLNEYGCSGEAIINNREAALQALQSGYAVIGGERGHYLAFVPVSSEDAAQGYVFKIIDSARGHDVLCRDFSDADNVVDGSAVIISIIYPNT